MLQNGVAGETQNPVNGTEDLAASRVDVTSAVESPASLPGVPMSLQGIHHYRASILTHLLELLEMLGIAKDHSATSCHQDIVENLPSAALTQAGSSDDDSKQDDSSSLLPEVNGNVGADVPQQSLIDAHDISDEAASVPVNTSCQTANGLAELVKSELRSCVAVQHMGTSVASNIPEFTSQGNSTPSSIKSVLLLIITCT